MVLMGIVVRQGLTSLYSTDPYRVSETAKWLKQAGFVSIKPVPIREEGTEDWEDGILEASVPGPRPRTIASQTGSSKNRKVR